MYEWEIDLLKDSVCFWGILRRDWMGELRADCEIGGNLAGGVLVKSFRDPQINSFPVRKSPFWLP